MNDRSKSGYNNSHSSNDRQRRRPAGGNHRRNDRDKLNELLYRMDTVEDLLRNICDQLHYQSGIMTAQEDRAAASTNQALALVNELEQQ